MIWELLEQAQAIFSREASHFLHLQNPWVLPFLLTFHSIQHCPAMAFAHPVSVKSYFFLTRFVWSLFSIRKACLLALDIFNFISSMFQKYFCCVICGSGLLYSFYMGIFFRVICPSYFQNWKYVKFICAL